MKRIKLFGGLLIVALTANAQSYKEGYVDWGNFATDFGTTVQNWTPGTKLNADDNFFISRVKPKERFRNEATQVRTNIDETNDKRIMFWVPIDDETDNAMPNGVFDSEVFNMWQYLSHYGNWTAPQGRMPGNFADVAHKNGVAVSSVAGIPYGGLSDSWNKALQAMVNAGSEKVANFLRFYGVDGLGYNSEFSGGANIMSRLIPFHKELKAKSLAFNPIFENVWYDGTNENGYIAFDQGYGSHNDDISDGSSLFFNYNWSTTSLLSRSEEYAKNRGYDPLYIYAGMNMQGGEPKNGVNWKLLKDYPISVGLWGAHQKNMFWESRHEKGGEPDVKQRTYQLRTERWFTGGTRNPANCPAVINSLQYNADNFNFPGMSSFMTAKSTLCWDLTTEPFITFFNLGNGKFFNWMGERQHNSEWYNIGVQDYLPTWRWWFTKTLLGRTASDVAENGLDAEFTWDDAWVGGSTVRIFGSTTEEYLHLFKTKFNVQNGDVITFRYKLAAGNADMNLVLTKTGEESTPLCNLPLCKVDQFADEDAWIEKTFKVGEDIDAAEIALVALQFKNVNNANIYLGEFSIVRGTFDKPSQPTRSSVNAQILSYGSHGADAKIVFDMSNDLEAQGLPCYNIDVKTSLFKLWAQQEDEEPILMGITTSWAGLLYNIPVNLNGKKTMRIGVSAVSLDMKKESSIRWTSGYMPLTNYAYNDDIQINKNTIKPNEAFEVSYVDPGHDAGTWTITDADGKPLHTAEGLKISVPEGLPAVGNYNVIVKGQIYKTINGVETRVEETRTFANLIQISGESVGALPEIYTITANDQEADITVDKNAEIALAYTGRKADGICSQAVDLVEKRFGVKCADIDIIGKKTFSTAFWLKIDKLSKGETQLLSVANKRDTWPKTDWGWVWINIMDDGTMGSYTFRGTIDASGTNNELVYKFENSRIPVGSWVHLAFVFDFDSSSRLKSTFYINGEKQDITGWKNHSSKSISKGEPGYEGDRYSITDGMVLAVGGNAHGRNGIIGDIDNFQVWNKAMTAEDVKKSMGDITSNNLPEGLAAFWDFEQPANADYTFKSIGTKSNIAAGSHDYNAVKDTQEGQGDFAWIMPLTTSGCPFIAGEGYAVETKPTWKTKNAIVENVTGNDEAGTATVKYALAGDYTMTLTLANSLGSDQRTFQVIKVGNPQGIEDVNGAEMAVYTVEGAAIVEFAEAGNYNVSLYTTAGQKVANKNAEVAANSRMQVAIANKGTYVLVVEKDGAIVRSVKLLNK